MYLLSSFSLYGRRNNCSLLYTEISTPKFSMLRDLTKDSYSSLFWNIFFGQKTWNDLLDDEAMTYRVDLNFLYRRDRSYVNNFGYVLSTSR